MTLAAMIGAFGALGALIRYALITLAPLRSIGVIAAINLIGSALAGSIGALAATEITAALIIGLCGGMTTFSTLAVQVVTTAKEKTLLGATGLAFLHGVGSGVFATLGYGLTFAFV